MNSRKEFFRTLALGTGSMWLGESVWGQVQNPQTNAPAQYDPYKSPPKTPFKDPGIKVVDTKNQVTSFSRPDNYDSLLANIQKLYNDEIVSKSDIGEGYKFTEDASDGDLLYHHVEYLLQQIEMLLERCITDRNEWNEKYSKAFQIQADITEFFKLDAIHDDEIKAGYYVVPYFEALADYNDNIIHQMAASNQAGAQQSLLNTFYSDGNIVSVMQAAASLAWLSYLPTRITNNMGNQTKYTAMEMINQPSEAIAYNLTTRTFALNAQAQKAQLQQQLTMYQANAAAGTSKTFAAYNKLQFEQQNMDFKRRRAETARDQLFDKMNALTTSGGALNYPEQMNQIMKRFNRDFRDAVAEIYVCSIGLTTIFGCPVALPQSLVDAYAQKQLDGSAVLDDAIVWTRNASSWLGRFSRVDQQYVMSLSLKQVLGANTFKMGLSSGNWTFDLADATFPNQYHVRLQGVSVFLDFSDKFKDTFQVNVSVPKDTHYSHKDAVVPASQAKISPVNIARVSTRSNMFLSDVLGTQSLHNVSPIGQWKVSLQRNFLPGQDLSMISDFQIDLHLTVRQYS